MDSKFRGLAGGGDLAVEIRCSEMVAGGDIGGARVGS